LLERRYDAAPYNGSYEAYISRPNINPDGTQAAAAPVRTLFDAIAPVRFDQPGPVLAAQTECVFRRDVALGRGSLHMVMGHFSMSDWDGHLSAAEATMDAFPANRSLPGAPHRAVRLTANSVGAHIVILDLNPNSNDLNRALMMSSNYFIVPCKPDYFSYQAAGRLCGRFLASPAAGFTAQPMHWVPYTSTKIVERTAASGCPFPNTLPKYLGFVLSDFAVRNHNNYIMAEGVDAQTVSRNVGRWMNDILDRMNDNGEASGRCACLWHACVLITQCLRTNYLDCLNCILCFVQDFGRRLYEAGVGINPEHHKCVFCNIIFTNMKCQRT
jgi:hypothetical protein